MRKKLILMFVFLTIMMTLNSCASELRIIVPEDENIVTRELREYLKKTPSPKIVLKVKEPFGQVSHHELSNYVTLEKELFKAGFIVRDRMLFKQVLESGGNSYKEFTKTVIFLESSSENDFRIVFFEMRPIKNIKHKCQLKLT